MTITTMTTLDKEEKVQAYSLTSEFSHLCVHSIVIYFYFYVNQQKVGDFNGRKNLEI